MDSDSFTLVADRLCELTDLDRIEARGTIRLAFKEAGVDVGSFGFDELRAVFTAIMPRALEARGCSSAESVCEEVLVSVDGTLAETPERSRDAIMRRLGGG